MVLWNACVSRSETQIRASSGHARHRPEDAAPARRRLRPPQHGARGRAGAHRAVGRSASASRSSRPTSARRSCCARGAASSRRPPGSRCSSMRARVLFTMDRIASDVAVVQQRRQGPRAAGGDGSAIAESLLDDIAVVHARAGQPQHQGRRRGAPLARPGAPAARGRRVGRRVLGPVDLARPRAPALPPRPARAGGPSGPSARRSQVAALRADAGPRARRPAADHARCTSMLQRAAARVGRAVSYRVVVSNFDAAFRVVAANLGDQRGAGRGRRPGRRDARHRGHPADRRLGAAPLRGLLPDATRRCSRRPGAWSITWCNGRRRRARPRRDRAPRLGAAAAAAGSRRSACPSPCRCRFRARCSAWPSCCPRCSWRWVREPVAGRGRIAAGPPVAAVRAGRRRRHHAP